MLLKLKESEQICTIYLLFLKMYPKSKLSHTEKNHLIVNNNNS